ncbi:hypothetical protein NLI96_g13014 [Meripilus lineatus]|uniref:Uncharacterized protein n=1 Tax=Meripilus lineatus TaxID=2056292 RepID=A0AAD5YBV5_9APHY|nr:hypothetical protein NLI96_g13014 [Physisporinus lineatus]
MRRSNLVAICLAPEIDVVELVRILSAILLTPSSQTRQSSSTLKVINDITMAPRGSKSKAPTPRPSTNPRTTRRNAAAPPADIPLPPSRKPPTRRAKGTDHATENVGDNPDAVPQDEDGTKAKRVPKPRPVPRSTNTVLSMDYAPISAHRQQEVFHQGRKGSTATKDITAAPGLPPIAVLPAGPSDSEHDQLGSDGEEDEGQDGDGDGFRTNKPDEARELSQAPGGPSVTEGAGGPSEKNTCAEESSRRGPR